MRKELYRYIVIDMTYKIQTKQAKKNPKEAVEGEERERKKTGIKREEVKNIGRKREKALARRAGMWYTVAGNHSGRGPQSVSVRRGQKRMKKATVYFTRKCAPESVVMLYEKLGSPLQGRIAVKLHSGEKGNQNFLGPSFFRPIIERTGGRVTECNTAYEGERNSTEKHLRVLREHGWSEAFPVDLMDAEGPDAVLEIPDGRTIRKNYVGKHLLNYDSMLVLSHFKGHPMGGYGGALKQLSIGVASSYGKAYIHGAGKPEEIWTADHDSFLSAMADAAASVVRHFAGNIAYINAMMNMSVDCDCCAVAEDPCMKDIGILASMDPVAIDRACLDLVQASTDPGRDHLMERILSRNGFHTVDCAEALGIGTQDYELVSVD